MSLLLLQAATSCGLKTLWQWQTSRLRTSEFLEKASFHKARDMLVVFVAFVLSRNGTGLWLGATESSPRISLKNERAKGRSNEWHESKQASVFWHKQPYSNLATLIEHRKRPLKGALAAFSKRFDKRLGVLLHFCLHAIAKHSHQSPTTMRRYQILFSKLWLQKSHISHLILTYSSIEEQIK